MIVLLQLNVWYANQDTIWKEYTVIYILISACREILEIFHNAWFATILLFNQLIDLNVFVTAPHIEDYINVMLILVNVPFITILEINA